MTPKQKEIFKQLQKETNLALKSYSKLKKAYTKPYPFYKIANTLLTAYASIDNFGKANQKYENIKNIKKIFRTCKSTYYKINYQNGYKKYILYAKIKQGSLNDTIITIGTYAKEINGIRFRLYKTSKKPLNISFKNINKIIPITEDRFKRIMIIAIL